MTRTITIEKELADRIEKEEHVTLDQFVRDAIMKRLDELRRQKTLTEKVVSQLKHIWTRTLPSGEVELGITDVMRQQSRTVCNVVTHKVGDRLRMGEPFGVVESWMFVHDLFSPVAGTIVAVNPIVIEDPFKLNVDTSLWIIRVKPD